MRPHIQRTACPACNGSGLQYRIDGQYARAERERAGLSMREVARRMKFSAPYLCDLELGRRPMNEGLWEQYKLALVAPKKAKQ